VQIVPAMSVERIRVYKFWIEGFRVQGFVQVHRPPFARIQGFRALWDCIIVPALAVQGLGFRIVVPALAV
jgi:hypothetical protein